MNSGRTYRAHVGTRTFEVEVKNGQVVVDGAPVACSFEPAGDGSYLLILDGRTYPVVFEGSGDRIQVSLQGRRTDVRVQDERALLLERFGLADARDAGALEIHAPMPGLVLRVLVEPGQQVAAGAGLLVLEAMKMENELRAPNAGTIKALHASPGDAVGKNDLLIEFEA